jgi:DNA replication protein DnaC
MHPNFKDIDQSEEDKQILYEYGKSPAGFLLLAGKNGSGKSFAAEAIYNMNTSFRLPSKDDEQAIFITQADLNIEWTQYQGDNLYLSQKYKNTKLLVIDDLGTRKPSDAFMDFLYAVVDHRWRNRDTKGTIITTNLTSNDVRALFGDALLSRIASGIVRRWDHKDRRMINF